MTASVACAVSHAPRRGLKHIPASGLPWTAEQEDELRKLAAEGFSAREISRKLSVPRSRNAVLGRARRLGVKVGMTLQEMAAIAREFRENNGKPRPPLRHEDVTEAEAQLFWTTTAAPQVAPALAPRPQPGRLPEGRSVYELTHSCCRWIDGETTDPRPFKCDKPAEPNSSWCAAHFKRAYAVYRPMRVQTRELA